MLTCIMFQIGTELALLLRLCLHDEFGKTLDTITLDTGLNKLECLYAYRIVYKMMILNKVT